MKGGLCAPHGVIQDTTMDKKIRCVLVHDHILLRQGLRRLLEDQPDLEVVSEAGNAAEALQRVFEHRPDVVIADARALGLSEGDAQHLILRESPKSKVVFLSTQASDDPIVRELPTGGIGFAVRETSAEELAEMVRKAYQESGPGIREMSRKDPGEQPPEELLTRRRGLTGREREVLKLLAEGRTVRSVAGILGLSAKTVDAHKFNLMRKLGIHNKAELVMWAIQKRVVKIPANF
jgi:two-component system, NarL family, response regulator NreC